MMVIRLSATWPLHSYKLLRVRQSDFFLKTHLTVYYCMIEQWRIYGDMCYIAPLSPFPSKQKQKQLINKHLNKEEREKLRVRVGK